METKIEKTTTGRAVRGAYAVAESFGFTFVPAKNPNFDYDYLLIISDELIKAIDTKFFMKKLNFVFADTTYYYRDTDMYIKSIKIDAMTVSGTKEIDGAEQPYIGLKMDRTIRKFSAIIVKEFINAYYESLI